MFFDNEEKKVPHNLFLIFGLFVLNLRIKINDKILNDVSMTRSSFSNSKKLDCLKFFIY